MPVATDLQIVQVPIDELRPDPANPRRISDADLDTLTKSMRVHGFVLPVLARLDDKTVIGGHQRLVAARRLGHKTVPTIFLDVDQDQAHVLNLALNKISGEWDQDLLGQMLKDLSLVPDLDLSLSGFNDDELKKFLKRIESEEKRYQPETFDLDAALAEVEHEPVTKPGDLWLLGDHRLLCGDSTGAEDVDRLFDGKLASLLATDPPYLVDYTGGEHPPTKANGGKANKDKHWDEYKDPESSVDFFVTFLKLGLQHLKPNSAVYQWHATRRQALVEQAWVQNGLLVHQTIIWAKAHGVLTRSHYLWSHEPCFYGWVEGKPPSKKPPSGMKTVWQIDQVGEPKDLHPTIKPVELFLAISSTTPSLATLSTSPSAGVARRLIAAERTGRICYAVDQEPRFVDVARLRWESFSGQKAVLAPREP